MKNKFGIQNNVGIIPDPKMKVKFNRKKILEEYFKIGKEYPVDPHITRTRTTAKFYPMIYTSTDKYEGFAIMVDNEIRHFAPSFDGYKLCKEGVILPMSIIRKIGLRDLDYEILKAQIENKIN